MWRHSEEVVKVDYEELMKGSNVGNVVDVTAFLLPHYGSQCQFIEMNTRAPIPIQVKEIQIEGLVRKYR